MKFCIIGYGSRGNNYASIIKDIGGSQVTSVCDILPERLELAKELLGISSENCYLNEDDFFRAEKKAQICIVSTQDRQHIGHALKALDAGYDLLLEKPIATSLADIQAIHKRAKEKNAKVFICHVLRYAPFFLAIKKELASGIYGNISTLNLTENVAYWHQAHSYVRGKWADTKNSSPMIIAKCCHDLDLISWFFDKKCSSVSSYGSLSLFKPERAPQNSAERCLDCAASQDCPYDAERFYVKERFEKGMVAWPVDVLAANPTREKLYDALRNGPYGKCVFKCNNDAVDHQVVNMLFEDNSTAHLTMTAFSKESYRELHIHCEYGEIYGNMEEGKLYCNLFGKDSKVISPDEGNDANSFGHGGGDYFLIKNLINSYETNEVTNVTSIENSLLSHYIGFAAEKSRENGGMAIDIKKLLE